MNRKQFQAQCIQLGLADYHEDDCAVLYDKNGDHLLMVIWSPFHEGTLYLRGYHSWFEDMEITSDTFMSLTKSKLQQIVTVTKNTNEHIEGHLKTIEVLKETFPDHISKILEQ